MKYGPNGSLLTTWGELGLGDGEFYYPGGVATDSSGNAYVADSSNERVQKFGSDGTFITKWDVQDPEGYTDEPNEIAVDSSGNVYVSTYSSIYRYGLDNGAVPKVSVTKPAARRVLGATQRNDHLLRTDGLVYALILGLGGR